jgi:stage V sporulation protein B
VRGVRSQSFLHGAAVLAASGIIVKIIGAVFKIPLGAILKPEGMACFSIAYNIYALLFVLSTAGVPVAVSKMVAEAVALKRFNEVGRIYKVSYAAFALMGIVLSVSMAYFADFLARLMGSPESAHAIRLIAPAVMFVSVVGINRGYYQGFSNMYPSAASEIIEASGKLFIGLGAAWWLSRAGYGTGLISAGAAAGVTIGAFLSAAYFMFLPEYEFKHPETKLLKRSKRSVFTALLRLALPITAGAAAISLTNVIDSALVMNILQKSGVPLQKSMWLYGSYTYAANLFNLPNALVATIAVSLIPRVSAAYAKRDIKGLNMTACSALKIAMLLAMSAAAGLYALSYPIVYLLYGKSIDAAAVEASAGMLRTLALAVPLLATVTLTSSIHQSVGNVGLPVVSMLAGSIVKIVSNIILIGIPEINIFGAPASTVLCYAAAAGVNMYFLIVDKNLNIKLIDIYMKPIIVGILTGYAAERVYSAFSACSGVGLGVLTAVFFGVISCIIAIIITKTLTKNDYALFSADKKSRFFLKFTEKYEL